MDPSIAPTFFTSSIVVTQNAIKNIIFRTATIILDFVILRLFGLLAFQREDYTSFLMFAEDLIQKAWFVSSRGITARQSLLVAAFALIAAAGEFYDTMLWAIDNPGFVTQHRLVNAATLSSQNVNKPSYVVLVSADATDPSQINNLNTSFDINLYNPGFNFTLPGVFEEGVVEVAPPLLPLSPVEGAPRIWLDDEGFAVGLDLTSMQTINMSLSVETACIPVNAPNRTDLQVWNCNVPDSEALSFLELRQGEVLIWWDLYHNDWLSPYPDNIWDGFGTGAGSLMMKQVFTVTKGFRRHTFKQTVIKASMTASAPGTLEDGEIIDFMRRTWSTDGTISTGTQELIDIVLNAKGNHTGRTFGELLQANTSLVSMSTSFLTEIQLDGAYIYSSLLFILVNTTLIRSETLTAEVTPLEPCPGTVYHNAASGGVATFTTCTSPILMNQTLPLNQNRFLGQVDTSTVAVLTGFLGDGSSNQSSIALSQAGVDWVTQQTSHIDNLLISRAMLMGGNASAVMVDVGSTVAAISGFQLVLCIFPALLAIAVLWYTRDPAMSYYQNSFLSAVLATTHTTATLCEELGYIHSMPEITLQRRGRHVTLGTPHDGTISNTVSIPLNEQEMLCEPLILDKDRSSGML